MQENLLNDSSRSAIWYLSNAGPGKHERDSSGEIALKQAAGGLVVLRKAIMEADAKLGRRQNWVCTADTALDQEVGSFAWNPTSGSHASVEPVQVTMINLPPDQKASYKGQFSDRVLWLTLHGMPHNMTEAEINRNFDHYLTTQRDFADHVIEKADQGDTVVVDDFQLWMVPSILQEKRPDLNVSFYLHVPVCTPEELKWDPERKKGIPEEIASEIFSWTARGVKLGTHSPKWAANFIACHNQFHEPMNSKHLPYAVPGYLNPEIVRSQAQGSLVDEKMDEISQKLGFSSYSSFKTAAKAPRSERSPLIGFVGRFDPKNGLEELLEWYLGHLDDPKYENKLAFALVGARAREGSAEYDQLWNNITDPVDGLIAKIDRHPKSQLVTYPTNSAGAAHAIQRMSDIPVVPSRRGGRDLVAIEPIAKRQRHDPPATVVVSESAAASETLVAAGRPGGIKIEGIDSSRTRDEAIKAIDTAMHAAATMTPEQVHTMYGNAKKQVALENSSAFAGWVEAQAHEGRAIADAHHHGGRETFLGLNI